MVKNASRGFTLVEVTIVLAITAGLLLTIIKAQSGVSDSARFKQSVELATSTIDGVRSAAVNTSYIDSAATGNNLNKSVFGKLVVIPRGSSLIQITDIINTNNDATTNLIDGTASQSLSMGTTTSVVLPWGVKNSGRSNIQLVFHRLESTGALKVYQVPWPLRPLTYNYSENPGIGALVNINLTDSKGRNATVTVDGGHGGAVSRVYR